MHAPPPPASSENKTRALHGRWIPPWLFVGWVGCVLLLSSIKGDDLRGPEIPHLDKIAHFILYSSGAFILAWLLANAGVKRVFLLTICLIAVLGGLDEFYQTFTPGRSGADFGDWLADVTGGVFGAFLLICLHERLERLFPSRKPD